MSHVVSVHVGCCCGACWNRALAEYCEAKPVRLVFLYVRQIYIFFLIFACRTDRRVHTWRWMPSCLLSWHFSKHWGWGGGYQNKWWNRIKSILHLAMFLFLVFSVYCPHSSVKYLMQEGCLFSPTVNFFPLLFSRLVVSGVGGPGLPAAVAPDWYLLVSVLPSYLLLLRQLPLLPGALLLSPRTWVHTAFTSNSPLARNVLLGGWN